MSPAVGFRWSRRLLVAALLAGAVANLTAARTFAADEPASTPLAAAETPDSPKPEPRETAAESEEPRVIKLGPSGPDSSSSSPWDASGVQDFSFTERNGKEIGKSDLLGEPWICGMIFTQCRGPCPKVSEKMEWLQEKLKGTKVRFVTLAIDPDNDTLDVLKGYANSYHADPQRWLFLRGDKNLVYSLIHKSFKMPVQEMVGADRQPGYQVFHSSNLMLVDAQGKVVGKYNAVLEPDVEQLRRDAETLARTGALPEKKSTAATAGSTSDSPESRSKWLAGPTVRDLANEKKIPEWARKLPAVNATLNGIATVLLVVGYVLIKQGRQTSHKVLMLAAFGTSIAFLACYLVYHAFAGSRSFLGPPAIGIIYYAILITHIVLAIAVPVLASLTIYRAWRQDWVRHRRIAKITFPIWLYVSVTGVIIYLMLYHWPVMTVVM